MILGLKVECSFCYTQVQILLPKNVIFAIPSSMYGILQNSIKTNFLNKKELLFKNMGINSKKQNTYFSCRWKEALLKISRKPSCMWIFMNLLNFWENYMIVFIKVGKQCWIQRRNVRTIPKSFAFLKIDTTQELDIST